MKVIFIFLVASIIAGCANNSAIPYRAKSIVILAQADKYINVFNNETHTVLVRIYQLKDITSFVNLAKDKQGITQLMTNSSLDDSFITSKKFVINPGETKKITLDRFNGAKFLGIVSGFYKYGDINQISWHIKIPEDGIFHHDLQIFLKINRDSMHAKKNNWRTQSYKFK